jgi:hypothetical protein
MIKSQDTYLFIPWVPSGCSWRVLALGCLRFVALPSISSITVFILNVGKNVKIRMSDKFLCRSTSLAYFVGSLAHIFLCKTRIWRHMKTLSECFTVHCKLLNLFCCNLLVLQLQGAFYWYSLLLQLRSGSHSSNMMLMCYTVMCSYFARQPSVLISLSSRILKLAVFVTWIIKSYRLYKDGHMIFFRNAPSSVLVGFYNLHLSLSCHTN